MNKVYIEKTLKIANELASSLGLTIEDVEWVKEAGEFILRIIADSKEGLTIDQATELNNLISDRLDVENYIEEEYMLEVSSPGIERVLKNDEDIINSIVWHTTGRPKMSLLEKIIFVADYIEPLRYKQKNLKEIRELAFSDLNECVYVIARDTVDFIESHGKNLDDMTVLTRDFYKK